MKDAPKHFVLLLTGFFGSVLFSVFFRLAEAWGGATSWNLALLAGIVLAAAAAGLLIPSRRPWIAAGFAGLAATAVFALCGWLKLGWLNFAVAPDKSAGLYLQTALRTLIIFFLPFTVFWTASIRGGLRSPVLYLGLLAGHFAVRAGLPFLPPETFIRISVPPLLILGLCGMLRLERRWLRLGFLLFVFAAIPIWTIRYPMPLSVGGGFGSAVNRDCGFSGGHKLRLCVNEWSGTRCNYEDADYGSVTVIDGRPVVMNNRFAAARILTGTIPLLLRPVAERIVMTGPEAWVYRPTAEQQKSGREIIYAPDGLPKGEFEVIFVAPAPAWRLGSGAFRSRGFYADCRRSLVKDGILAVHFDARALDAAGFARELRTLQTVFPQLQIWCTGVNDWLVIASSEPVKVPLDLMLMRFDQPLVAGCVLQSGLRTLPEVFSAWVCGTEGALKFIAAAEGKSEASPMRLVFDSAQGLRLLEAFQPFAGVKLDWLLPGQMDADVYLAVLDRIGRVSLAARPLAVQMRLADKPAPELKRLNPRDVLLLEWSDRLELEAVRRHKIGDLKGAAKAWALLFETAEPGGAAAYGFAQTLRALGEKQRAYEQFKAAASEMTRLIGCQMDFARAAVDTGRFAEACSAYERIARQFPEHRNEADFLRAKVLMEKEWKDRRPDQAVAIVEALCVRTRWKETRYAFGLADLYIDGGRALEGLKLKRRLKEATAGKGN